MTTSTIGGCAMSWDSAHSTGHGQPDLVDDLLGGIDRFPHCDARVLHAPGACGYCDARPVWQELRRAWGVGFTGEPVPDGGLPCPADYARPPGSEADHRRWAGNKPTGAAGDASWPAETAASVALYGDRGGRAPIGGRRRFARRWRFWRRR